MIKTFVSAVCGGAMLLAIYGIWDIKKSGNKGVAFVFALIFAVNLISALPKGISITLPETQQTEIEINESEMYRNAMYNSVKEVLDENGINYKKININMDISEDKSINLLGIEVESNDNTEKIENLFPGINVTVVNYEN